MWLSSPLVWFTDYFLQVVSVTNRRGKRRVCLWRHSAAGTSHFLPPHLPSVPLVVLGLLLIHSRGCSSMHMSWLCCSTCCCSRWRLKELHWDNRPSWWNQVQQETCPVINRLQEEKEKSPAHVPAGLQWPAGSSCAAQNKKRREDQQRSFQKRPAETRDNPNIDTPTGWTRPGLQRKHIWKHEAVFWAAAAEVTSGLHNSSSVTGTSHGWEGSEPVAVCKI